MDIQDVTKNQRVTLTVDTDTFRSGTHKAGGVYRVLGLQGTCVRLSREGDHAKLITTPDRLQPAPLASLPKLASLQPGQAVRVSKAGVDWDQLRAWELQGRIDHVLYSDDTVSFTFSK